MNKGPNVSQLLPALARSRGFNQAQLEKATGIAHSTMSRYWSGSGGLGLGNGRKIAAALDVEISALGLSEADAAVTLETLDRRLQSIEAELARVFEELEKGRRTIANTLEALEAGIVSVDERLQQRLGGAQQ